MRGDVDADVRVQAAVALSGYSDEVATQATVAELATLSTSRLGYDMALGILSATPREPVLRAAVDVLSGDEGTPQVGERITVDKVIDLLAHGARPPSANDVSEGRHAPLASSDLIREVAAHQLGRLGDPAAIDPLVAALLSNPAVAYRSSRSSALADFCGRGTVDGLVEPLVITASFDDPVVEPLAGFGLPAADAVIAAVRDLSGLSPTVLRRAAGVLYLTARETRSALIRALESDKPWLVCAGAGAVPGPEYAELLPVLVAASSVPGVPTRVTVLAAVGRMLTRPNLPDVAAGPAVRLLLVAATDDSRVVRRVAVDALSRVACWPPEALSGLSTLLRERPPSGARVAAAALSSIYGDRMQSVVADTIRREAGDVRRYALLAVCNAVPQFPGSAFDAAIAAAREDSDETIRRLAVDAAQKLSARGALTEATAFSPADAEPSRTTGLLSDPWPRRRRWSLPRLRPRLPVFRRHDRKELRLAYDADLYVAASSSDVRASGSFYSDALQRAVRAGPRFPDVTVFAEAPQLERVSETTPLCQGAWYRVEVAIRSGVTGLNLLEGDRAEIPEWLTGAPTELLVAVDSDDFEIDEPLGRITLPFSGDESTENAWFRVRPHEVRVGKARAALEIRLYYKYNLVQVLRVEAVVVPRFDGGDPGTGEGAALGVRLVRRDRDLDDLREVRPRSMHIDVQSTGDRYVLTFAFATDIGETVLRGTTPVTADELDSTLVGLRETLRDIALSSPFADAVDVDEIAASQALRRLAESGRRLWAMLFRRESEGGLARIGELLRTHPLPVGATIQVSVAADSGSFVFPWALIYDGPRLRKDEPPDSQHFWGARYIIEHGIPGVLRRPDSAPATSPAAPDPAAEAAPGLAVAYMLWNRFRNTADHTAMLERLQNASAGRLSISAPPILDADACLDLIGAGKSDMLYFYTHGFTRRRGAALIVTEELDRLKRWYEGLDNDDPRRASLRSMYETLTDGTPIDRSYIGFPFTRLYLDDLYDEITRLPRAPVVLLNMCESAQISPSLSDSFVHFFLDRGARSVIGTECPMTVSFAHPFAEELLSRLFRGIELGQALLETRQAFLTRTANPLGLAYTLYGSATASFVPPIFPPEPDDADHRRSFA